MMRYALMAAVVLFGGQAFAQQVCVPISEVAGMIARYGEVEAGGGIENGDTALMVFANPSTGTFTLVRISPARPGLGCVIAVGTDWAMVPQKPGTPS